MLCIIVLAPFFHVPGLDDGQYVNHRLPTHLCVWVGKICRSYARIP